MSRSMNWNEPKKSLTANLKYPVLLLKKSPHHDDSLRKIEYEVQAMNMTACNEIFLHTHANKNRVTFNQLIILQFFLLLPSWIYVITTNFDWISAQHYPHTFLTLSLLHFSLSLSLKFLWCVNLTIQV